MAVIAVKDVGADERFYALIRACTHLSVSVWPSHTGHTPDRSYVHNRPTRSELAQLINQARLDRHISIRSAARIAGVPAATVQGWLAGRHFPTPALRPKFLLLVEALELDHYLHPALWIDDLPQAKNSG
jgi:DNA-binding transcriptional regulator YiaG